MIRVALADDHQIFRIGVKRILEKAGIYCAGEFESFDGLAQSLHLVDHDVLLFDLSMPSQRFKSSIETLQFLLSQNPSLKILVLSFYPPEQYAVPTIRAGAKGYLTKECIPEQMIQAIEKVASGELYITEQTAKALALNVRNNTLPSKLHENLSSREYQVFFEIAQGKSLTEIADAVGINIKTVGTYRSRILEKMNFKSNMDIIRYALKNGIVQI